MGAAHRRNISRTDKAPRRLSGRAGDVLAHRRRDAGIARRHGAPAGGAQPMTARLLRILVILAAGMGADGVLLAAASAHQADASRLAAASSMLPFHSSAVLAAVRPAARARLDIQVGVAPRL